MKRTCVKTIVVEVVLLFCTSPVMATLTLADGGGHNIARIIEAERSFFAFQQVPEGRNTLESFDIGGPVTVVGIVPDPLGGQSVHGAEFDSQGQLWASFQAGYLAVVNQQTADFSIIGNCGVSFEALVFGADESLYGVRGSSSIYLIDKHNANITLLADLNVDYSLVGLVFSEDNDVFYGIDNRSNLYKIDLEFQAIKLGTISGLPNPRGLTLGPNSDIFAVTRRSGLFKINQEQVTATDMATTLPWDNQSLAYGPVPEPATLLLLGLGGLALVRKPRE